MGTPRQVEKIRCAIYTRKSTDETPKDLMEILPSIVKSFRFKEEQVPLDDLE